MSPQVQAPAVPCTLSPLAELLSGVAVEIVGTAIVAIGALAFWRYGAQFVGDYRRLRVEACTLLSTHAPFISNLSSHPTDEGLAARRAAQEELRRIGDRLTNTDCPAAWLARLLGMPSSTEVWEAGRALRALSSNLLVTDGASADAIAENERINRTDRDTARSLLGCRAERPGGVTLGEPRKEPTS